MPEFLPYLKQVNLTYRPNPDAASRRRVHKLVNPVY